MANTTEDTHKLIVSLEARVRNYERNLAKAQGTTNKRASAIENRTARMRKKINADFSNALKGAIPAVGLGLLGREFVQFADANTRVQNALKTTGLEGEKLKAVYDALFASAQRNFVPFEALADLYSKVALVQKELGVSASELVGFSDNVALALRASGKSAAESSGALLQLSQALGAGTVRAEEFNSILEGAPTIAQAVAAGLTEAGGSVAKLRGLVIDGAVSSEAFFRAFEAGAPSLASKVASAEVTVSQALTRLQNELTKSAGEFDNTTGASNSLLDGLDAVTKSVPRFAQAAAAIAEAAAGIGSAFVGVVQAIQDYSAAAGRAVGADKLGAKILESRFGPTLKNLGVNAIPDRGSRRPDALDANVGAPLEISITKPAAVTPVSLKSFAPPVSKSSGGSRPRGGGGGRGSGGRGSARQSQNELEREIEAIRKRTTAIQAETAAQSSLNPLVDDYGFAVEKARQVQDLLTAAQEAGVKVTPELRAKIDALGTGYAAASVDAERLAQSQDAIRERAEEFASLGKDVTKGFISDLRAGKTAAEALEGAIGKIADRLLDLALDSVFSGGGGGGLGGLFGSIFGGRKSGGAGFASSVLAGVLHSGGSVRDAKPRLQPAGAFAGAPRHHTGLRAGEFRAILEDTETVLTKHDAGRAVNALGGAAQALGGKGASQGPSIINIDARGAQQGVGADIAAALREYDQKVAPRRAIDSVQKHIRSGGTI